MLFISHFEVNYLFIFFYQCTDTYNNVSTEPIQTGLFLLPATPGELLMSPAYNFKSLILRPPKLH